ncbi:hypothetical protein POM88_021504 [Heracleum sosnowskyi]|uniref:Uncharacterized protein n=1 Tax=Heracleum sosnowskyi TaxID=360622 RepID=A0AAD8IDH9_9APIA|nr:hypothetical protein POM88_021504 [Heracleum sosnowskyi]
MAAALKSNASSFLNLNTNQSYLFCPNYTKHYVVSIVSSKSYKPPMAALSTTVGTNTVGLSETFTSYKVIVVVKDNSAKTTFTLFNKEVERHIGVPVQNLIDTIGQLTIEVPPTMRNVIGKKCAFEVKLSSFNRDGREGYGVARLSEITGTPPIAEEVNNADAASTSKKQKLA